MTSEKSAFDLSTPVTAAKASAPSIGESWNEVLRSGVHVVIRPIRKEDIELERRFIEHLSARSSRYRFLDTMRAPSNELLTKLVDVDAAHDVALIALAVEGSVEREIGVARLSAVQDAQTCEFAIVVSDEWQRKGVGRLLIQHLADNARARGLQSMYSMDTADNDLMRGFAGHLGLQRKPDPNDATQVLHVLDLATKTPDSE